MSETNREAERTNCPRCGCEVQENGNFCPECGAKLITADEWGNEERRLMKLVFLTTASLLLIGSVALETRQQGFILSAYFCLASAILSLAGWLYCSYKKKKEPVREIS